MSSFVHNKYINLLTNFWYICLSTGVFISVTPNLWLGSIWVVVGLHANLSVSCNRSWMYFYWGIKFLNFEQAISVLSKYFNLPNFFISNSLGKHCFSINFSSSSSPVTITSSIYVRRVVILSIFLCLINRL